MSHEHEPPERSRQRPAWRRRSFDSAKLIDHQITFENDLFDSSTDAVRAPGRQKFASFYYYGGWLKFARPAASMGHELGSLSAHPGHVENQVLTNVWDRASPRRTSPSAGACANRTTDLPRQCHGGDRDRSLLSVTAIPRPQRFFRELILHGPRFDVAGLTLGAI